MARTTTYRKYSIFTDIKLSAAKKSSAGGKGKKNEAEQVHVFTNFPNPDDSDGDDTTKSNVSLSSSLRTLIQLVAVTVYLTRLL